MIDFEMPLKNGGLIQYNEKSNTIVIVDSWNDVVEFDADELIKFTNSNFWKHLSKQTTKDD